MIKGLLSAPKALALGTVLVAAILLAGLLSKNQKASFPSVDEYQELFAKAMAGPAGPFQRTGRLLVLTKAREGVQVYTQNSGQDVAVHKAHSELPDEIRADSRDSVQTLVCVHPISDENPDLYQVRLIDTDGTLRGGIDDVELDRLKKELSNLPLRPVDQQP